MRHPSAFTVTAAVAFLAATVLVVTPAAAQKADIVCHANYDFCVEVDGKYPPDARFFTSETRGKFFVDIPSKSSGLLIDLPARRAIAVPGSMVKTDAADGVLRVADDIPSTAHAYALSIEGPVLSFQTDSSKVRVLKVLDRPPVVGPVSIDELVNDRPEYRVGMQQYHPDKTALDALKQTKKKIEIEAYFATWCPHCKVYMPKLLEVLKEAANPNIKVTLVGVPRNFGNEKGPWEGKGIQMIPAILIKYDGKEITRLASHEGAIPESEIAGIVSALK
jgi:thiol-disulfide isomerase/thioredoxin